MQKMFFMIVAIIEAVFSAIVLIMLILNSPFLGLFTDYAIPICAFFSVAAGFLLIKKYGIFNSLFGKCFSFLTTGLTLWCLGELLWPIYSRVLNVEMLFPSLMDFLWMGGYIFIGIGVYIIFTIFKPNLILKHLTQFLIIFLTLMVILAIIFLTPIIYKASFLEQVIYCYYLTADIIILSLLIVVYRIFKEGEISKAWLILVLGIMVIFLADIFFNLATSIKSEFYLSLGDLIYINGYSLTALGLIKHSMKL